MSSSIIIPPPEQVVVTSKRVACDGLAPLSANTCAKGRPGGEGNRAACAEKGFEHGDLTCKKDQTGGGMALS